ncbi:MAG TPA: hypothetical protein VFM85_02085 [Actinomycetota bacterium]|nr:hypothetical protein [Actinomycetota bacterium]
MNRTLHILAWGVAGVVLTGALIGAAIAVAGNGIATPVRPFSLRSDRLEQPDLEASKPHEGRGHDRGTDGGGGGQPGDDVGGDGASGSNSGPGSGSSGSGSDEGSVDPGADHDGDGGDDD